MNSVSGKMAASSMRRPATVVPLSDPRSRSISSPSCSNNSQWRRLTSGCATVRPACLLRPITVGSFSGTARLLALPLTTTSFACIAIGLRAARPGTKKDRENQNFHHNPPGRGRQQPRKCSMFEGSMFNEDMDFRVFH